MKTKLEPRDYRLLNDLEDGMSYDEIAANLGRTVKSVRDQILAV